MRAKCHKASTSLTPRRGDIFASPASFKTMNEPTSSGNETRWAWEPHSTGAHERNP